jgi:hypothetical protein
MRRQQRKPRTPRSKPILVTPKPEIETFSLASFAGMVAVEEGRKVARRRRWKR